MSCLDSLSLQKNPRYRVYLFSHIRNKGCCSDVGLNVCFEGKTWEHALAVLPTCMKGNAFNFIRMPSNCGQTNAQPDTGEVGRICQFSALVSSLLQCQFGQINNVFSAFLN